ncbi:M48 family metalloprotease [Neomegalonema perideroedes]|uniref:M48 family metalloprotease n=1 Tax=Neomegalonema perideroedes TaxID=217219 RepID=UPI00146E925C|nr:M48 family metalloprotease [Neomegalonema perideroedes]
MSLFSCGPGAGRRLASGFLALGLIFGAGAAPAAARTIIRDSEIERTLKREAEPVLSAAGIPVNDVRFFIVQDPSFNAFIADGRTMGINTGALLDMTTPEEVMAVMAHEAGHMAGGHHARRGDALRAARGQMILTTVLGLAAGAAAGSSDVAAAGVIGGQQIGQRAALGFSRGEESAADQAAVGYLERAGVDPSALNKVIERLRRQEMLISIRDPYVLTHPMTADRAESVAERIARSPLKGAAPDSDRAYWHARLRAKLAGFLQTPARTLAAYPASDLSEPARLARASAYHKSALRDQALAEMDALLAARPSDPWYWELRGQIRFESGDPAGAVADYQRAVSLAPEEPLIRVAYGQALLAAGQVEAGRDALIQSIRQDELNPHAWRQLSIAAGRLNDQGLALTAAAEALALGGDVKAAKAQAERAQAVSPHGSVWWMRAGDILALPDARR